eukprot:scaffold63425_cov56-Attheya_sp.AAC.4
MECRRGTGTYVCESAHLHQAVTVMNRARTRRKKGKQKQLASWTRYKKDIFVRYGAITNDTLSFVHMMSNFVDMGFLGLSLRLKHCRHGV